MEAINEARHGPRPRNSSPPRGNSPTCRRLDRGETQTHADLALSASQTLEGVARTLTRSVAAFAADVTADLIERRKDLRVRVDETVTASIHGRSRKVRVLDLSDQCACIANEGGLTIGEQVVLEWAEGASVNATVMWTSPAAVGLKLARSIEHPVLIQSRPSDVAA